MTLQWLHHHIIKDNDDVTFRELEEENASLQAEYERLKAKQTPGSTPEEQHALAENRNAPVDQVRSDSSIAIFFFKEINHQI